MIAAHQTIRTQVILRQCGLMSLPSPPGVSPVIVLARPSPQARGSPYPQRAPSVSVRGKCNFSCALPNERPRGYASCGVSFTGHQVGPRRANVRPRGTEGFSFGAQGTVRADGPSQQPPQQPRRRRRPRTHHRRPPARKPRRHDRRRKRTPTWCDPHTPAPAQRLIAVATARACRYTWIPSTPGGRLG